MYWFEYLIWGRDVTSTAEEPCVFSSGSDPVIVDYRCVSLAEGGGGLK